MRRPGQAGGIGSGPMDDAKLRGLVAASRTGVLATVDPDGTPQMSNIYFIADADGRLIRFSTTTVRRKEETSNDIPAPRST